MGQLEESLRHSSAVLVVHTGRTVESVTLRHLTAFHSLSET